MDPNEALKRLRELLSQESRDACEDARELYDLLTEIGEQFEALDGWITKGGFRPNAWDYDSDQGPHGPRPA